MEQTRGEVLAAVDALIATGTQLDLAAPPQALGVYRAQLEENLYQVMVVGEVKRGKSSFINALIGQRILPTDVDVATSQVFRIQRTEQEAYRLRFEDGSTQDIERADLPRYGSQVVADVEGTPRLDQIIRWIEIDVPVRFLPREISLLDSPGLGGLYELHAEITLRFIPQADAVVFALDSTRPIIEEELKYLEEILQKTRSVFFIQTKIDLFRAQQWQDVQRRNEEILRERFEDRLLDFRVWPISSRLLSEAAVQEDPDFEIASRHRELAPALQEFLFRASGWTRMVETLVLANDFHHQSNLVLVDRHKALLDESKQQREQVHQQLNARREQFLEDWGERGKKRRELREGVQKVASLGKTQFNQFLARSGELESNLQSQVMAADSLESLRALADRLPSDAAARAMKTWREVTDHSWNQCLVLLAPFLEDAEQTTTPYRVDENQNLASVAVSPNVTRDWFTKMKAARMDFMTGVWAGSVGGSIGGSILVALGVMAAPAIAPIAAVASLIGGILSALRGTKNVDNNQLRTSKQEVCRFAVDVCQRIRQHFLDVNLDAGTFSTVDEYFNQLQHFAENQIDGLIEKKASETEAEIERLKTAAALTDQQREAEAERLREQMVTWREVGRKIDEASKLLQTIDRAISGDPPDDTASGRDAAADTTTPPGTSA